MSMRISQAAHWFRQQRHLASQTWRTRRQVLMVELLMLPRRLGAELTAKSACSRGTRRIFQGSQFLDDATPPRYRRCRITTVCPVEKSLK